MYVHQSSVIIIVLIVLDRWSQHCEMFLISLVTTLELWIQAYSDWQPLQVSQQIFNICTRSLAQSRRRLTVACLVIYFICYCCGGITTEKLVMTLSNSIRAL